MPQNYVLVSRKNPLNAESPSKYYAQAIGGKTVDVYKMCKRIGERSSYSIGELEGVIGEFLIEVQNVLEDGDIAQMGRLGNFRLTIKSSGGTETAKEFTSASIKSCAVRFHAGPLLKDMCKRMKYTPYSKKEEE